MLKENEKKTSNDWLIEIGLVKIRPNQIDGITTKSKKNNNFSQLTFSKLNFSVLT
jgi:hypothetical protein